MSDADVAEILKLPPEERMRLVELIWESLVATPSTIPLSDAHRGDGVRSCLLPPERSMLAAMARPLRIEFPGAIYHVTSRGDRREPIFEDDT
ncbi:MAG: addiction module protein, partial [Burkholderiales bacterium]|nr:addiction module protein [Burkholderiales bacterium]